MGINMSAIKVLKKGEYLFREGDKIQSIWVVQSGQMSLCVQKNKKNVEIMNVGTGFVFGDLAVLGIQQYNYAAMAVAEVKLAEIPLEGFKQQYEALHQINKTFIKGISDRLKWTMNEVKVAKLEKDPMPCSEEAVPKIFGVIYHVMNYKGTKEGNRSKLDWMTLRQYSQRIFGESIKRLEQAVLLLIKLKMGEYVMGVNPDDPDGKEEIQGFILYDVKSVETFFEFFQYYYYKGGKSELLKFDEANFNTVRLLCMAYEGIVPDKFGVASKDFAEVTEFFKDYGVNLGAGHFTALEAKGLFCKRKPIADGKVHLQFEIAEFKNQLGIWRIVREIDKWNEKGYVDIKDVEEEPKKRKVIDGVECTTCHAVMASGSKFCSDCGSKLTSSVAPAAGSSERKAA